MTKSAARAYQLSLPELCPITDAVNALSEGGAEERGAVFTRTEVVNFILDLVGYEAGKDLRQFRFLEPSFGGGDFLFCAIGRLMDSWQKHGGTPSKALTQLGDAICAVELHRDTFAKTSVGVVNELRRRGLTPANAHALAGRWLKQGDFLLTDLGAGFDFVVGNPPYVRQEMIPDALMAEYRARYSTIYDRADLYIPFIERSLTSLNAGGKLGFICADRWMKNRYGGPLRKFVADGFHLSVYVDMVDTPAFHSEVIAYPAITVIANKTGKSTRIAHRPQIDAEVLRTLAVELTCSKKPGKRSAVREIDVVTAGIEPWLLTGDDKLALVRRLEADYPTLEQAGCKVGIGVATGADKAFIGMFDEMDVEADRKLPLVMTRDILTGQVAWRGFGVINPFADEGGLVDLAKYPRLSAYLEERREEIAGRHVAKRMPAGWYRTIDRIYPALTEQPKLLIPDIKGGAHIAFDEGRYYPHHNLYFITSETWDLRALRAVLLSGIARLFIETYSTKMRGGYLRFQAQYLRRIRVPEWHSIPAAVRKALIAAGKKGTVSACEGAVAALYGLRSAERKIMEAGDNGRGAGSS